jgi:hypothetical protein
VARRQKSSTTDPAAALAATGSTRAPGAKQKKPSKRLWSVYAKSASVLAAVSSAQAVNLVWRASLGRKAPASPENPEVTMREAVAWAIVSGSAAQLARIVATRRAVDYWVRSTGQLPPGIKPSQISPGVVRDDS